MPLNWQLVERGAELVQQTTTSKAYRLYALSGGPPDRPGLQRDVDTGERIDVEVWSMPANELGSFIAAIPAPLGIGKVELDGGQWLSGFICEAFALKDAEDITHFRSWRNYLEQSPG